MDGLVDGAVRCGVVLPGVAPGADGKGRRCRGGRGGAGRVEAAGEERGVLEGGDAG